MTANDYQREARRTMQPKWGSRAMMAHAAHGIASEAGEIASLFQHAYQGEDLDFYRLKEELGDACWFIAEMCEACGWSLGEVMQQNIAKLRRRYPNGFTPEESRNRNSTCRQG